MTSCGEEDEEGGREREGGDRRRESMAVGREGERTALLSAFVPPRCAKLWGPPKNGSLYQQREGRRGWQAVGRGRVCEGLSGAEDCLCFPGGLCRQGLARDNLWRKVRGLDGGLASCLCIVCLIVGWRKEL